MDVAGLRREAIGATRWRASNHCSVVSVALC